MHAQSVGYLDAGFGVGQLLFPGAALGLEKVIADGVDGQFQPGVADLTQDLGDLGLPVAPEIVKQFDALRAVFLLLSHKFDKAGQVNLALTHGRDDAPHTDAEFHATSIQSCSREISPAPISPLSAPNWVNNKGISRCDGRVCSAKLAATAAR